jgi:hypothetical protein
MRAWCVPQAHTAWTPANKPASNALLWGRHALVGLPLCHNWAGGTVQQTRHRCTDKSVVTAKEIVYILIYNGRNA